MNNNNEQKKVNKNISSCQIVERNVSFVLSSFQKKTLFCSYCSTMMMMMTIHIINRDKLQIWSKQNKTQCPPFKFSILTAFKSISSHSHTSLFPDGQHFKKQKKNFYYLNHIHNMHNYIQLKL